MPRGSVIAGRIVDEFGEPVADAASARCGSSGPSGRRKLTAATGRIAQTNDLGQFRLYGLPPGEYYVSATLRNGAEFMAIEMLAAERCEAAAAPVQAGRTPTSGYAPTYFPGTPTASDAQKVTLTVGQESTEHGLRAACRCGSPRSRGMCHRLRRQAGRRSDDQR